ncbi:MAG TPA: ABC transporter substrate-binding protein [Ottowia sp.]|nr:ABC transporter substrate-binding protein [Ottowia sp.]HMT57035.1 ABC transporter substrate-binding protein [Ottowia sp.]HMT64167.1 ABC transporter substrate-binding protein [Ottowia sp.]HMT83538.1 ABC transporter substrate-binding protein [Ottowia sp.]HOK11308.1 ABC transporter substrate-binding protein [Ottowia sp.]
MLTALGAAPWAWAAEEAPDALIQRLSTEVLDQLRNDKALKNGDIGRVISVVDGKVMPNVNFTRMTASATGPGWRRATPEQRQKLQQEFKTLLVHTYAGALRQVSDQTVEVRPLRAAPEDKEVVVRTWVKGRGEPVQLDYRLERTPGQGSGWKIYDLNVLGVWLVDNYRPQFAQQINAGGIDALIHSLAERNQANARGDKG